MDGKKFNRDPEPMAECAREQAPGLVRRWRCGRATGALCAPCRRCCRCRAQLTRGHSTSALDTLNVRNSRREKVAYFLDRILAKRWRFFVALSIWGLLQVIFFALAFYFADLAEEPHSESSFTDYIWEAWTDMADPGTHAQLDSRWQRVVGSLTTLSGILFFASILAVTVDIVREKMDALRQGKSRVIEKNHTLILGWTEKSIHIIEELCAANESENGGVIVVLAPHDKMQMETELALQLPTRLRRGTRVIFRTGSPLVLSDLTKVSVQEARAIIILSTDSNSDQADSDSLRTMLSLRSLYNEVEGQGHVVAEVRDIDNEPLMKLVGGSIVETIVSHDVIGRLMLMSVRQPGLAKVYEALLGFDGDEFYMAEWPEITGLRFGHLLDRFPDAIPIGIQSIDGITLCPDFDLIVKKGDKLIVIAEDNDTYKPEQPNEIEVTDGPPEKPVMKEKEKILFCGWRRDIRDVLQQLDGMVRQGTEVHMMTHCVPINQRLDRLREDGLDVDELRNLHLVQHFGNTSVRRKLEMIPIQEFSSCMIFADQAYEADTLRADSHSLATLLLIRDIQAHRAMTSDPMDGDAMRSPTTRLVRSLTDMNKANSHGRCPIICEVLDPHTQKTIASNQHLSLTSDFCQTNKLIAQVLAMVAEERTVNLLFDELLGSVGCNIAVIPSSHYAWDDESLSFQMLAKRAARRSQVIIGYQLKNSIDKTVLNPPRKDRMCTWSNYDFAILRGQTKLARRDAAAEETTATAKGFIDLEKRSAIKQGAQEQKLAKLEAFEGVDAGRQYFTYSSEGSKEPLKEDPIDCLRRACTHVVALDLEAMSGDDLQRVRAALDSVEEALAVRYNARGSWRSVGWQHLKPDMEFRPSTARSCRDQPPNAERRRSNLSAEKELHPTIPAGAHPKRLQTPPDEDLPPVFSPSSRGR